MRAAGIAAVVLTMLTSACAREAEITSCDARLDGAWLDADGRPWAVIDNGATLEVYPMFDDSKPAGVPADLVPAPRVIDLARADMAATAGDRKRPRRASGTLAGSVKRRYTRGADSCIAKASAAVTTCTRDGLELVLADPPPPVALVPCTFGTSAPSRRERWRRM